MRDEEFERATQKIATGLRHTAEVCFVALLIGLVASVPWLAVPALVLAVFGWWFRR